MYSDIYYIFSSITFLQIYIPLVIEATKRGFNNFFILRSNSKDYADPFSKNHINILQKFTKTYNIKTIDSSQININQLKGIIILIDGDIYGPPRNELINQSLLRKFNRKNTIICSFTEHQNFGDKYRFIEPYVDFLFFENKKLIDYWSSFKSKDYIGKPLKVYHSNKNIYNINPKYDNIDFNTNIDSIYQHFKLPKKHKYCLFLYPKTAQLDINQPGFEESDIFNIYSHLHKLNYKIIVKLRPKTSEFINQKLTGDYFVQSDTYPNETLLLLRIVDLCITSSSSASSECLFTSVPCIDLETNILHSRKQWPPYKYLLDNKFYKQITNTQWRGISFPHFKHLLLSIESKNSKYISNLRHSYFPKKKSSKLFFDFLQTTLKNRNILRKQKKRLKKL